MTTEVSLLSLVLFSIVLEEMENETKNPRDNTKSGRIAEVRMY